MVMVGKIIVVSFLWSWCVFFLPDFCKISFGFYEKMTVQFAECVM
jgi:hypothetical protein